MAEDVDEKQREQDRGIVLALRAAQWELENVAHDLPAGRVTARGWVELADSLDQLRELVRLRSKDASGPTV